MIASQTVVEKLRRTVLNFETATADCFDVEFEWTFAPHGLASQVICPAVMSGRAR